MNLQIVVDLETLDTAPSAHILTVALVLVDVDSPIDSPDFVRKLFTAQITRPQPGRTVSLDTQEWWDKQSITARCAAFVHKEPEFIGAVMRRLADWLQDNPYPIWGNGSDFDNAILQHAFNAEGLQWPYYRNRCLRTLRGVAKDLGYTLPPLTFEGTKHVARDDAIHEAEELKLLMDAIKGDSQ